MELLQSIRPDPMQLPNLGRAEFGQLLEVHDPSPAYGALRRRGQLRQIAFLLIIHNHFP